MIAVTADIIEMMEAIAPPAVAEGWDNVGLQSGKPDWPVKKILVSLDASLTAMNDAVAGGFDMLISHHPLMIKGIKKIDFSTSTGDIISKSALNAISLYAAHTNLDSVRGGLNDLLAEKIGLKKTDVFVSANDGFAEQGHGLGRIANIDQEICLSDYALQVKKRLNLPYIRVVGRPDLPIKRVALCTGSGASLLGDFFESGAQVYVSGDMRYHDARDVEDRDLGLLDIGHFYSEHIVVELLARRLAEKINDAGFDVIIQKCKSEEDPYRFV